MTSFNPATDISSLEGKVFLITGGTAGLGAGTINYLAAHKPAHIYFTGRNSSKAEEVIAKTRKDYPTVPITYLEMDSANLTSVDACATKFLGMSDRLDVLICNAGIMGTAPGLTQNGFEVQYQVNHLAHALLIERLLPLLDRTAEEPNSDVRIINLASQAYKNAPKMGIDFDTLRTTQGSLGFPFEVMAKWYRYGQAKLANLLYPIELTKRHPKIMSVAVHPGYIPTDLVGNLTLIDRLVVYLVGMGKWLKIHEGPYNQVWAATVDRSKLTSGAYYEPFGKQTVPATKLATDDELARTLWDKTHEQMSAFH